MKLDAKDYAVLSILSMDARLTNRDLARRIGLSPSACLARVRKLEDLRVIVGYRAVVAPTGRGDHLEGWANVRFIDPAASSVTDLRELLHSASAVIAAYRVAGRSDYLLRFSAPDSASLAALRNSLEAIPGQPVVQFSVLIEALK